MHYAEQPSTREKIERHIASYTGADAVKIAPCDIKPCGQSAARFELRGDEELKDGDYVTDSETPVMYLPGGLSDEAVREVLDAWAEGYETGKWDGRAELRREIRDLLED